MKTTRLIAVMAGILALSGLAHAADRPAPAVPFGSEQMAGDSGGKPAGGPNVTSVGESGMAAAGARLVATQNSDGGWGWPLSGSSAPNTVGPIGTGLAKAYRATGDAGMLAALGKASTFLLAKTNNFSPSDGYLAAELDSVLGGTANVAHVKANFYDKLASGTYNRNGAGTLYDTAAYVNLVRTNRASQGIPNLAAWDVAMGLIAAASCGVSGSERDIWIAGVEGEVNELTAGDYDVIGLAGALYALATVHREFDPTAGMFAGAGSLSDLANTLVTYQLSTGGFTWSTTAMGEGEGNETIQETAYAVMALNAMQEYREEIDAAADYMVGVQLGTGGWENYPGSGENNEVTAEGTWGVFLANNILELNVASTDCLYVKPGEPVVIDMDARNLLQMVDGCQALIAYSSAFFNTGSVVPGGGDWTELIYESWTVPGELDTAIGVKLGTEGAPGPAGTDADGTVAVITLTAKANDGVTRLVFRPDGENGYATMYSDLNHQPVWPSKLDSQDIVVDGTAPLLVTNPADGTSNPVSAATQTIMGTASDALAGIDTLVYTLDGGGPVPVTVTSGAFSVSVVLSPGTHQVVFTLTDKAGNTAASTINYTYTQLAPTIDVYHAIAPNATAGASSWNAWLANEIAGARDKNPGPIGSGYAQYLDLGATPQDYAAAIVSTFNSWMGLITTDSEWGNRTTYVYRLDNGVQTNPGAAKLNLDNIAVTWIWNYEASDDDPADPPFDVSYTWAVDKAGLTFAGGTQRLKGYNWDGSAWVEVTSGREADLIIYNNGEGYEPDPAEGGGSKPATQATLNELYKQLSGALPSSSGVRQKVSDSQFEVTYAGHADVSDAASGDKGFTYTSADTTKPVITITAPADGVKVNVAAQTVTGTAADNEDLASGIREVKISLNGTQVYLNDTQDNVSFSQAITLADGDNAITVDAKDFAGNTESTTIHVILDTSAPTVNIDSAAQGGNELLISLGSTSNAVQGDVTITVSASDTGNSGLVTPPAVTVTPAGGTPVALLASGGGPWTYTYTIAADTPNGIATINASVSDGAGNTASDMDTFNINKNQVTGQVELEGFVGASRDVTFKATGGTAKTWTLSLSFSGGVGGYTLTDVPDGTTGISAKTAWNLRRKAAVALVDGQATADFTGAAKLLGGDINGDNFVNVLDYSVLKNNWYTANAVADINGDGSVQMADYLLLKANFFKRGDGE